MKAVVFRGIGDIRLPADVLTQMEPMTAALDAYKAFDLRRPGWIKVKLEPEALAA